MCDVAINIGINCVFYINYINIPSLHKSVEFLSIQVTYNLLKGSFFSSWQQQHSIVTANKKDHFMLVYNYS